MPEGMEDQQDGDDQHFGKRDPGNKSGNAAVSFQQAILRDRRV
jgi:hypothetical protein